MNLDKLQELLQAIIDAETSEDKVLIVMENPLLMSEEVIAQIRDLSQESQADGEEETAQILESLAQALDEFHDLYIEPFAGSNDDAEIPLVPSSDTFTTHWTVLTRQHIAQGNENLLIQAIEAAIKVGEFGVVEFLQAYQANDVESMDELGPLIHSQQLWKGHTEEAWTIALAHAGHRAVLTEVFRSAPQDQHEHLLSIGLEACQNAIDIARILEDDSCIARFEFARAHAYQSVQRLPEAETGYRNALEISLRLAQTEKESTVHKRHIAATQSNLGNLFSRSRRLPEAEAAYRVSLKIRQSLAQIEPANYESEVAITQNNLGNLFSTLQRLSEAETAYRVALEIYSRLAQAKPSVYESYVALTQSNMGNLLKDLRRLPEAESALRNALEIYLRIAQAEPHIYEYYIALTQNTLGTTLVYLRRLPEAETAYHIALEIYSRLAQSEPNVYESHVAATQNNLGALLRELLRLTEAEAAYRAAQEIYKHCDDPTGKVALLNNLGQILTAQPARRAEGIVILYEAMETVESLRAEVLSIERQQQIVSENFGIYENLLIALMLEGRFDEALELAEKSRNRTLTDLMVSRDLEPRNAPPDLLEQYRETLARARALNDRRPDEMDACGSNGAAPDENSEGTWGETRGGFNRLEETYRQLDDLTGQLLKFDPEFLPRATSLKTDEICQLARDCGQTLVSFRITNAGSFVFLVFPDGETDVVSISDFSADDLQELMVNAPAAGQTESGGGWVTDYYNARQNREATSQWNATLERTLGELHARLMRPVRDKLRGFTDLVLVPNRALAILPLHACWWQSDDGQRHYWLDEYTIRYAPSLTIYGRCLKNEEGRGRQSLLGIANPTNDLRFAQWECREIEAIRGDANCLMLWNNAATRGELEGALVGQHLLHFSCHGRYDLGAPLNSAIALAGSSELSLADIFQHIQLPQSWLVVLSACETGLSDFRQIADEQFGLSTGFLYAGAPTVYSSLWAVEDGSTALLMIMVYELLQSESNLDKATLLIRAQRQLRDSTTTEIEQLLAKRADSAEVKALKGSLNAFGPTERPYEHPVAWAAFQCVGV